jgi:repressor of nif and glnA expression
MRVLALSTAPTGFKASELAEKVRAMSGEAESAYGPRRAAYDLKKLRGKGMVRKIGASRRYEPLPAGLRAMAAIALDFPVTPAPPGKNTGAGERMPSHR